ILPQETGSFVRCRHGATGDLAGVVDGGRGTGGTGRAAQRAQVGHDAVVPEGEGARPEIADDLPRVVQVGGNSVLPQVQHEIVLAIAVTVAEPAIGYAVLVRVLGCEQKAMKGTVAGTGGSDDLSDVVDADGVAVTSAECAEVGHDAVLPEEGMAVRLPDDLAVSVDVVGSVVAVPAAAAERAQVDDRIARHIAVFEGFEAQACRLPTPSNRSPT